MGQAQEVPQTPAYGMKEAQDGAAFRIFAAEAVKLITPGCPHSVVPETMAIMAPAIQRYERLKASVSGTSLAIDLAIVEADNLYPLTLVDLACPESDAPETEELVRNLTMQLAFHLDNMERLAQVP
ncbi:hypothetical protein [Altererythrobacter sp. ZODW24]|uniref:hypothetical protein n=1 Tax=Altererythrobacter sp. ZODW24 TaxID=2185142 RepID=UPI000DF7C864|nr:hypothetical protein [Altererythrobacter sp. ZODW24]